MGQSRLLNVVLLAKRLKLNLGLGNVVVVISAPTTDPLTPQSKLAERI